MMDGGVRGLFDSASPLDEEECDPTAASDTAFDTSAGPTLTESSDEEDAAPALDGYCGPFAQHQDALRRPQLYIEPEEFAVLQLPLEECADRTLHVPLLLPAENQSADIFRAQYTIDGVFAGSAAMLTGMTGDYIILTPADLAAGILDSVKYSLHMAVPAKRFYDWRGLERGKMTFQGRPVHLYVYHNGNEC